MLNRVMTCLAFKKENQMKKWNNRTKKGRGAVSFKPSRNEIKSAVDDFLKNGGKIKKIEVNERNYKDFVSLNEPPSAADDFLKDF